jgi:hypothetical protein
LVNAAMRSTHWISFAWRVGAGASPAIFAVTNPSGRRVARTAALSNHKVWLAGVMSKPFCGADAARRRIRR